MTEEPPVLVDVPGAATPLRRSRPRSPVVAAAIGLVVGAAGVGVPWFVTAHDAGVVSGLPLSAPATLGGVDKADVSTVKFKDDDAHRQYAQRNATNDRENGNRISAAYDGAPALVQTYTAVDFTHAFQLTAVRAHSPGLAIPYEEKNNGLVAPTTELRHIGDVSCVLHNDLTPLDDKQSMARNESVAVDSTVHWPTPLSRGGRGHCYQDVQVPRDSNPTYPEDDPARQPRRSHSVDERAGSCFHAVNALTLAKVRVFFCWHDVPRCRGC